MRVLRTISWILTFVAIGAAAAAWFTPRPDIDAEIAGDVAVRALEDAGIDEAAVVGSPTRGTHTPTTSTSVPDTSGPPPESTVATDASTTTTIESTEPATESVPVWIVAVGVENERIEMRVHDTEAQLVYVDDLVGENRDTRLLTDEQWETVRSYRDDHLDVWIERNIAGSVAAGLIVVVGFVLARRTGHLGRRPS